MKLQISILTSVIFLLLSFSAISAQTAELPREWIDPDTGHRIVRLSDEAGSSSFYFHQNGYTASGDKLVFSTPTGLSTYNFKTKRVEQIVDGRTGGVIVGRRSRKAFYWKGDSIFETDLDTRATREVIKNPKLKSGSGLALNADETLLGGSMIAGDVPEEFRPGARPPTTPTATPTPIPGAPAGQVPARDNYPGKGDMMERRLAAKIPMSLYTVNIKTGELKFFHPATDWLNHVQFSPTDPTLMMFCHEGPWHKVDRIWTIRTDDARITQIHTRTMAGEIFGHEFWSPDGKTIWYDLQTPRGEVFWLAGYDLATAKRRWYKVDRNQWSVHYNISPDQNVFSGDGGDSEMVAHAPDGKWLYLFRPKAIPDVAGIHAVQSFKTACNVRLSRRLALS